MADYHTVYKEADGTTTEWHDIQVKLGNLPAKEAKQKNAPWEPKEERRRGEEHGEEEEDWEEGAEDDKFMEEYRRRRVEELKAAAIVPQFGALELIKGPDFVREVTNASHSVWVLVLLFQDSVPACALLGHSLQQLAAKFPGTKFVKMVSTDCIPNYPDSLLPTLLVYKGGQVKEKFVGLQPFSLGRMGKGSPEAVALALCQVGPVLAGPEESEEEVLERVRKDIVKGLVDHHARDSRGNDDDDDDGT